jgi:Ku protein
MAPRANWKGFLRLSLVTCPVALYPATSESEKISFNQLNRKTGHRIKYAKVDADTGEEVANEDIVKGYKVDTDTFIEVTKEELENVALESTRTIEIDEFVDRSDIDPRYLIRPYYLRPDGKVGHDAFAVIRETIREMAKVAIGRVVLTNREHIIALEPLDKGLMGTLLRYPYEVWDPQEYFDEIQDVKVKGHARSRHAHREPEVGSLRARQVRGPVRNRAGRPHQPEARRQADHAEGEAGRRQRRRPDGGAAPERRQGSRAGESGQARQEAAQGRDRAEGDADVDRRQEGQGGAGEETGVEAPAEVCVSGRLGRRLPVTPRVHTRGATP